MNIIQQNRQIDRLINNSNSANLSEDLSILALRKSSGSLGDYEISNEDAINFLSMSKSVKEEIGTGTGADTFPGIFFIPKKCIHIFQETLWSYSLNIIIMLMLPIYSFRLKIWI